MLKRLVEVLAMAGAALFLLSSCLWGHPDVTDIYIREHSDSLEVLICREIRGEYLYVTQLDRASGASRTLYDGDIDWVTGPADPYAIVKTDSNDPITPGQTVSVLVRGTDDRGKSVDYLASVLIPRDVGGSSLTETWLNYQGSPVITPCEE